MIVRCLLDITLTVSVPPNHGCRFLGSSVGRSERRETSSLQLERGRVAKLLSMRNAKQKKFEQTRVGVDCASAQIS